MVVIFLLVFGREILNIIFFLGRAIGFGGNVSLGTMLDSVFVLCFNCCGTFGFTFFVLIMVYSQALLPVARFRDNPRQSLLESYRTIFHLILHVFGFHGPAIFVQDGRPRTTESDWLKRGPGVILVDFNSAVVLEEQLPPPNPIKAIVRGIAEGTLMAIGLMDRFESPRARGTGLVFTRPRERIRGVVDLRKQTRARLAVRGYTRDGIELEAKSVWVLFTIGDDPDIVQIAYQNERSAENLRALIIDQLPNGNYRINRFVDELDTEDARQIHYIARVVNRLGELKPYRPIPRPPRFPQFNQERVFSAVFAQAHDPLRRDPLVREPGEPMPWHTLPVHVVADVFREELSRVNYDQVFQPDMKTLPEVSIPELRNRVRLGVRNSGILSFRLVIHRTGEMLQAGREYLAEDLLVTQVMPMNTRKVLRERGIKVVACGFSEMHPISESVRYQRLKTWRAGWDANTEIARATHELNAMRIRSRARAQTQQELIASLAEILDSEQNTDEVLALRVFQALESAAADPNTRKLLPSDVITLLYNLHNWLTEGQDGDGNKNLPNASRPYI